MASKNSQVHYIILQLTTSTRVYYYKYNSTTERRMLSDTQYIDRKAIIRGPVIPNTYYMLSQFEPRQYIPKTMDPARPCRCCPGTRNFEWLGQRHRGPQSGNNFRDRWVQVFHLHSSQQLSVRISFIVLTSRSIMTLASYSSDTPLHSRSGATAISNRSRTS